MDPSKEKERKSFYGVAYSVKQLASTIASVECECGSHVNREYSTVGHLSIIIVLLYFFLV